MFSKQLIIKAIKFFPSSSHNDLGRRITELDLDSRGIDLSGSIPSKKTPYAII